MLKDSHFYLKNKQIITTLISSITISVPTLILTCLKNILIEIKIYLKN